jgi:phosphate starvation-inducible PhoH-like protein
MPRSTVPVVDSKRLLTIFGPRDQHLRRIRATLGVGVSARDDSIHIEGDQSAVMQATEVFEQLARIASERGTVESSDVASLLSLATGGGPSIPHEPI